MATEPVKAILDYVNGERPPGFRDHATRKYHPPQDVIFEEAGKERLQPRGVDDTAVYLRANQSMFDEVPRALGQEVLSASVYFRLVKNRTASSGGSVETMELFPDPR